MHVGTNRLGEEKPEEEPMGEGKPFSSLGDI